MDDYAGYKALFAQGVTELACLAHAWWKFFDLYAANQSPIAAEALRRIGELYEVERQAQEMDAASRRQIRQQEAGLPTAWRINGLNRLPNGSG